MSIIEILLKELDQESKTTKKMLERIPEDKYDWKPHSKSMSIRQLATHIAELPTWISMGLSTSEMDFATSPYNPPIINKSSDLMDLFKRSLESGMTSLKSATEKDLSPQWTLRNGDKVLQVMTKYEVIRHAFNQIIHHRAQLGVFLRLLDVPIPGTYGPSADEMNF